MKEKQYNVVVEDWRVWLQLVVYATSRNYPFYQAFNYPLKKDFEAIDKKLISKYGIIESKFARSRNQKKGNANYLPYRFNDFAVILKSQGNELESTKNEKWIDIRTKPLKFVLSASMALEIVKNPNLPATVRICDYKSLKAHFEVLLKSGQTEKVIFEFNALNGLPSWGGINEQKRTLKDTILKKAKSHNLPIKSGDLRINVVRKQLKRQTV